jgi:hypothetical protein
LIWFGNVPRNRADQDHPARIIAGLYQTPWQFFGPRDIENLNSATERDWTDELGRWLEDRFAELGGAMGQRLPLSGLRINPPLAGEEAKYFLLGLEEGLFFFDAAGCIQSELFPPATEGNLKMGRIFRNDCSPPRLVREVVYQLATASQLILKRGWLKSHVALEPGREEHRAGAFGLDLLVKSPAGKILVWVEVKRSSVELEKLVVDLRACSRRGPHGRQDCGFPQNHPRYEFALCHKPEYLWAVAPDGENCFRLTYESGSFELEKLPSLPPRSFIE